MKEVQQDVEPAEHRLELSPDDCRKGSNEQLPTLWTRSEYPLTDARPRTRALDRLSRAPQPRPPDFDVGSPCARSITKNGRAWVGTPLYQT